jgi:drug/metabolite transporter (DMT)-like permease
MTWLWWATIGYFLNAVAIVIDKTLLGRREIKDPAAYTLFISALGLLVIVLAPWGLEIPSTRALMWGLLSGTAFTLGLWLMFNVLKVGEASRVPAFIGSLSPVFIFILAWLWLGEHLSGLQFIAFLFLVLGGFLMVGGAGGLKKRPLLLAIAASLAFALAYVWIKFTFLETNYISGLIWTRFGGFASSLLLFFIPGTWRAWRNSIKQSTGGVKLVFIAGQTSGALSGLLISYAITLTSVTLVNALQGLQYVFLLIMSVLISSHWPQFFHDEFSGHVLWRKLFGVGAIGAGLWLLSFVG